MNRNIIRTALVASIAGAGLLLGAGTAMADQGDDLVPVADGHYELAVSGPVIGAPNLGTVPATVKDGKVVVAGVQTGLTAEGWDEDGDGTADVLFAMKSDGASLGELR